MDLHFTLRFAEQIAKQAGDKIEAAKQQVKIVAYKDRQDIVTNADLDAERFIITKIKSIYPNHAFYSEEKGEDKGEYKYKWIIDPIDGTKEYLRSLPMYNTCFALEKDGELVLSVLYQPSTKELYSSAKGIGSFENGKKMTLSTQDKLADSFIYAYLPSSSFSEEKTKSAWDKLYQILKTSYRLRGVAEEATAMSWVACGKIEAFVSLLTTAKWYDYAAGIVIADNAGATITNLQGKPITKENFNHGIIVSNGKIHDQLLKIINT